MTMADDTQSEESIASDLDEDGDGGDADASDLSDTDTTEPMATGAAAEPFNGRGNGVDAAQSRSRRSGRQNQDRTLSPTPRVTSAEIEPVLNGTGTSPSHEPVPVLGETSVHDSNQPGDTHGRRITNVADRRRREHEEYKKKRDSDPTFIPNRGGFFMHDARIPDQRGFSSFSKGRGRGRGSTGAPTAVGAYVTSGNRSTGSASMAHSQTALPERAADTSWKHDLHETVNRPDPPFKVPASSHGQTAPFGTGRGNLPRPLNFSRTTQLGKVQIRVLLPGAKAPILFSDVSVRAHARLPDHRPPLRRDKPVRISIPDAPPRYRFPSSERSFIFIPRALRPNQQGFGRARGSFGAHAGPASRRTSIYGGSGYSPSVSMSRRSSMTREVPRESAFSPTGSFVARTSAQQSRPVVRLPHVTSRRSSNASTAGSATAYGRGQPYPLPQKPAVEHWQEAATMYQPRPQKTISVTGIESPAGLSLHAPQQQDQQPFHNQLPHHIGETDQSGPQPSQDTAQQQYYSQAYMYPGGASTGTPLSNIPERAIHAQPFQPVPAFYPQHPAQGYYYPGQGSQYPAAPMFPPPMQTNYASPDGNLALSPDTAGDQSQSQQGHVAYETNGMVYYQESAPMSQYAQQDGYYQAPVYGVGGMMTPGPEFYYPFYTQP